MRTVVPGERPAELEAWLERRRALGQDHFDEVWEGEYHVAPMAHGRHGRMNHEVVRVLGPLSRAAGLHGSGPLNLGEPDDYRVLDQAYLRNARPALFNPTAAAVVEIVSPGDETRRKFGFYFRCGVEELLIVDPEERTVEWFRRGAGGFVPSPARSVLGITATELTAQLDWPD